jgi:hypothetical protein
MTVACRTLITPMQWKRFGKSVLDVMIVIPKLLTTLLAVVTLTSCKLLSQHALWVFVLLVSLASLLIVHKSILMVRVA